MANYYEDYSTESTEFRNLDPNDVAMREAFEDEGMYDIWKSSEEESLDFSEDPAKLLPVDRDLARGYNNSLNPIIQTAYNPSNQMPQYVVALIEHHHLGKGEPTSANQRLAKQIRDLGHQMRGVSIDQCGHIVARSLGGKMERANLFPIGRNTNGTMFRNAERRIYQFIEAKKKQKGRALLQVRLEYGDRRFPCRPTRFYYSYVLFSDDKDGKQKEVTPGKPSNVFLEITVANAVGEQVTVRIEEDNVATSRTKVHYNRSSQKKSSVVKFAEKAAFWSGLGIIMLQASVPDLFSAPQKVTTSRSTLPVSIATNSATCNAPQNINIIDMKLIAAC